MGDEGYFCTCIDGMANSKADADKAMEEMRKEVEELKELGQRIDDKLAAAEARLQSLAPQAKWLRMAAAEIAKADHNGWGNTCEQAADAIDAASSASGGGS